MIALVLIVIIVAVLALPFLWPPVLAILVIGAHPIIWAALAVVLVLVVVFLKMQRNSFNENDADRTVSRR